MLSGRLRLDEAQQTALRELLLPAGEELRATMQSFTDARQTVLTLVPGADGYDETLAEALESAQAAQRKSLARMAQTRMDVEAILTDDQRSRLAELLSPRREHAAPANDEQEPLGDHARETVNAEPVAAIHVRTRSPGC